MVYRTLREIIASCQLFRRFSFSMTLSDFGVALGYSFTLRTSPSIDKIRT